MKSVFSQVLLKINPSEYEVRKSFEIFNKIALFIKERYGLQANLMGSVAKNTFISGDKDLDIFVFFQVSILRDELEKTSLHIGREVFEKFGCKDYEISYAEHPYTKGVIEGFKTEIVPAYLIKSTKELRSAVDRTPFHTNYVISNLKNHEEVRLLKKYLKGIGCYGSDLKTEGFSGYLCELLIIKYAKFERVISEAQMWTYQQIIDLEGLYNSSNHKTVRRMFKEQPLIVIDPIDKNRNVAAVLSLEKLARFIVSAKKFSQKPGMKYFFPRKRKINTIRVIDEHADKGIEIYTVTFDKPNLIEDVLYPQLRKLRVNFMTHLKQNDFEIIESWVFGNDECGIGLKVMNTRVPKYKTVAGPSIFNPADHQERFANTHRKIWLKDDRYVTEVKRDCHVIDDCIRNYFSGSTIRLQDNGVPMNFARMISKGFKIRKGKKLLNIKSDEFWYGVEKENIK